MITMIISLSVLIIFLVFGLLGLVIYTSYQEQHKRKKTPRKHPPKKTPGKYPGEENSKPSKSKSP